MSEKFAVLKLIGTKRESKKRKEVADRYAAHKYMKFAPSIGVRRGDESLNCRRRQLPQQAGHLNTPRTFSDCYTVTSTVGMRIRFWWSYLVV